jgi:hypothetical protein
VDHAQITDEVFSVLADNHELGLPQFLVVGDLVVVGLTFTNFEDAEIAIKTDRQVFYLLCVYRLKVQMKLVPSGLVRWAVEGFSLEVHVHVELSW